MIVECQNCTTRFQLDESRIPLAGIRVRCSKCKEAFFLEHPSATQAQAVDELALDAAANEATPAPGSTQDLVTPPDAAPPVSEEAGGPANDFEDGLDDGLEDDLEDDWEFNHEEPVETPATVPDPAASFGAGSDSEAIELAGSTQTEPAAEEGIAFESVAEAGTESHTAAPSVVETDAAAPEISPGDSFSTDAAAEGSPNDVVSFDDSDIDISGIDVEGIDVDFEDANEPAPEASASPELQSPQAAASEFSSDGSPGSEFDHSPTGDLAGAMHPDGSITQEPVHFEPAGAPPDAFSDIAGESPVAATENATDLGEPEDWDLLGEDLPAPPVTAPARTPAPATTHMASPHAATVPAPAAASIERPTLRLQSGLRSAGAALGWVLTLSLLGATLWQGVQHSLADVAAPAVTEFEVGPLVARSIETAWIPTLEGRSLLSVRGELHNPTDALMKPQHKVVISLLDAEGMPLDLPELEAGRTIDVDSLRDLPTPLRERLSVEASDALSAVTLAGGASVPFAAYFSDVPPEARRVLVTGVEPELAYDDGQNLPWANPVAAELDPEAKPEPTSPISHP